MDIVKIYDAKNVASQAAQAAHLLTEKLRGMLPPQAEVEHVGATAVPGCDTKGDLDVVVRVSEEQFQNTKAVLSSAFEPNDGSTCLDTFASFKDDHSSLPVGVQLVVKNSPLDIFIKFRDALRADRSLLAEYNQLKHQYNGLDMEEYRKKKSEFIESTLRDLSFPQTV